MRRVLAGLGGRLAIACALIAVVCVVVTGAVMYTSARNNILQSEQNRLFDEFSATSAKIAEPIPCFPAECDTLSESDLISMALSELRGPVALALDGDTDPAWPTQLNMIPESFQHQVKDSGQISWFRQRQGLSYNFLIGAPVTLTLHATAERSIPGLSAETVKPSAPTEEADRTVAAYLYANYYMGQQQQQINSLATSTVWLVAVMALVAALIGVLLARWIASPVRKLRLAVDGLDAGHGALDVDVKGVQELTGLVEAFNAASSRLSTAMAELTAKEAQSRRFVADVSHELRTPVTAMVAMADVLENSDGSPEHVQEAAAVTARSARRLHSMTEDLLEISRFDAAQNTVHPETFEVREQLLQLLESRGLGQGVDVEVKPEVRFSTDPRRFDVIVGNLLVNAANHGAAPITLRAVLEGEELVVEVSDRGPGVPPESAGHLFERFYKSDTSRSRSGSGLGLSLVQENCRLLGGSVELTRAASPTTFTVRLSAMEPRITGSGQK